MSDVFPLGDSPRELNNDYILHILEYPRGPKRFGVCIQHKYEDASTSFKTVKTRTGTFEKFSSDFSWHPPSTKLKLSVESGDWKNNDTKVIEKSKLNQSTLPEEYTFNPPMNIGPTMAVEVKLINEDDKPILDSGQVVINFAEPVNEETRPGEEHPADDNMAKSTDKED